MVTAFAFGRFRPSKHRADVTFFFVFRLPQDVRFWALFVSFLCGAGSGLVVINNVASLADSLEMASSNLLVRKIGLNTGCPALSWVGAPVGSCIDSAVGLSSLFLFMTFARHIFPLFFALSLAPII